MGTHEDPMGTNGRAMGTQGDPWGPWGGGGGGEGPLTPIPLFANHMTHSKAFIQMLSIDLRMLHYSMPQSTHGATSSPHYSGTYSASRGFRKDGIQRRVMALMLSETGTSSAYGAVRDWRAMPGNVLATTPGVFWQSGDLTESGSLCPPSSQGALP